MRVMMGLLLLVALESEVAAQPAASGNKATATMKYQLKAAPQTTLVVLDVLLPRSIPGRQHVANLEYSTKPTEVYEKNGQRYAQFRLTDLTKDWDLAITVTADIYAYDYTTAARFAKSRPLEKDEALKQWLVHEQYFEKFAPLVQEAAKKLVGKDEDETLRQCFAYVVKTLTKRPYDDKNYGAVWALQNKRGDCTEFADLFIALCRANGIPARFCQGYLLEAVPDTPKHDWAEVYTKQYGWVPFDPFYAHLGKATFADLRPVYLLLDSERRNGVLQNHHFWAYRYDGNAATVRDSFRVTTLEKLAGK